MNIANKYWNKHFKSLDTNRKESDYGYNIRNTWRDLGFPSYSTVDEHLGLPKGTTNTYAQKYGYSDIRRNFEELEQQLKREEQEKLQEELIDTFTEVWNVGINDTKYQLQWVSNEIQNIEKQMKETTDTDKLRILSAKLDELWGKHDFILSVKFPKLQDKSRTNAGLTNNYKDNTADKLEIEHGEVTLNQNIKQDNLTKEEREKEYEAEFKRLLQEATTPTGTNAPNIQGNNSQ